MALPRIQPVGTSNIYRGGRAVCVAWYTYQRHLEVAGHDPGTLYVWSPNVATYSHLALGTRVISVKTIKNHYDRIDHWSFRLNLKCIASSLLYMWAHIRGLCQRRRPSWLPRPFFAASSAGSVDRLLFVLEVFEMAMPWYINVEFTDWMQLCWELSMYASPPLPPLVSIGMRFVKKRRPTVTKFWLSQHVQQ